MYSGPRREQPMRQGQNKRMRGRNRKGPNPLTRSYESNGPDVKIRGTALHIAEKYAQLARDAHSSGDRVAAESYYQHAEHYYRIIAAAQAQMPFPQQQVFRNDDGAEDEGEEHGFGQRPNPPPMQGHQDTYPRDNELPGDAPSYGNNGQAGAHPGTGEQPLLSDGGEEDADESVSAAGAGNGGGAPEQGQFRRRRRPHRGGRPDNREGNYPPNPGAATSADD